LLNLTLQKAPFQTAIDETLRFTIGKAQMMASWTLEAVNLIVKCSKQTICK